MRATLLLLTYFYFILFILFFYFPGVYVDSPTDFVVDSRAIGKRDDGKIMCKITNPSGNKTENLITPLADGTYKISYTPLEEGESLQENVLIFFLFTF